MSGNCYIIIKIPSLNSLDEKKYIEITLDGITREQADNLTLDDICDRIMKSTYKDNIIEALNNTDNSDYIVLGNSYDFSRGNKNIQDINDIIKKNQAFSEENKDLIELYNETINKLQDVKINYLLVNENSEIRTDIYTRNPSIYGATLNIIRSGKEEYTVVVKSPNTEEITPEQYKKLLTSIVHELLHVRYEYEINNNNNLIGPLQKLYKQYQQDFLNAQSDSNKQNNVKNVEEMVSYVLTDPSNYDAKNGDYRTRIINILNNNNISITAVNSPESSPENQGIDSLPDEWSIDDAPPFIGEFSLLYDKNTYTTEYTKEGYAKVSKQIFDDFKTLYKQDESVLSNDSKSSINYSELIPINNELQLFNLEPGDLLLIPFIQKNKEEGFKVGNFNWDYKKYKRYVPVQSIWTNDKGEVMVTVVQEFGKDNVGHYSIPYSMLVTVAAEQGRKPSYRKAYGRLVQETSKDTAKEVYSAYEESFKDDNGYYQINQKDNTKEVTGVFKVHTSFDKADLVKQELKPNDLVKVHIDNRGNKYTDILPVIRVYGTIVEVAAKDTNGGIQILKVPFSSVITSYFSRTNHSNITKLYDEVMDDYKAYRKEIYDTTKYSSKWFNYRMFNDTDSKYKDIFSKYDLQSNPDTLSALEERRKAISTLKFGDSVTIDWGKDSNGRIVSDKYLVLSVDGDNVYFMLKTPKDKNTPEGITVMSANITQMEGAVDNSSTDAKRVPAIAAVHYNLVNDVDIIDDFYTVRDIITKFWNKWRNKSKYSSSSINDFINDSDNEDLIVKNAEGDTVLSLSDIYDMIEIDDSNRVEELSQINRGSIVYYEEDGYTYANVVTNVNLATGVIEVAGKTTYNNKEKNYRKIISIDSIKSVGFRRHDNKELQIYVPLSRQNYQNKRLHRLYNLNHSIRIYTDKDIATKRASSSNNVLRINNPESNPKEEILYIVPAKYASEHEAKNYTKKTSGKSDFKTFSQGRFVLANDNIIKAINEGNYIDATETFKEVNGVKELHTLVYKNSGNAVADDTGYNRVFLKSNNAELTPDQIYDFVKVGDVIKIKYKSYHGNDGYTKFLQVVSKSDKRLKLAGTLTTLQGDNYTSTWNISKEDLINGTKLSIYNLYIPSNKNRLDTVKKMLQDKAYIPSQVKLSDIKVSDAYNEKHLLQNVLQNVRTITEGKNIHIYTNAEIDEQFKGDEYAYLRKTFKNSGAFIYNGNIYINEDKAKVTSPIHELMHLFMGVLRTTNPESYQKLLDIVVSNNNTDIKTYLYNRTLNDAKEEVFVEHMAQRLSGIFKLSNLEFRNMLNDTTADQDLLNTIFQTIGVPITSNKAPDMLKAKLENKNIYDIANMFKSTLFEAFKTFDNTHMQVASLNRHISNLKSKLKTTGNLIENCN